MLTIIETLQLSTKYLTEKGIERARRDSEELLCHLLNLPRLQLYLEHERPLQEDELSQMRALIARRGQREPLQYILGSVPFYNCTINVDKRVLIPRPETEWLVDRVSKQIESKKVLLDLCCGSGCIGIALKKAHPELRVLASDFSLDAIALAKHNARINEVDIEFFTGDLLAPFKGMFFDYCVCNPPYATTDEIPQLQKEVVDYEPLCALDGGKDGLLFYRRLAHELSHHMPPNGKAWFEIGAHQGHSIIQLFDKKGWIECYFERDLAGFDRYISLVKE